MRALLACLLSVVLFLGMGGCGSDAEPDTQKGEKPKVRAEPAKMKGSGGSLRLVRRKGETAGRLKGLKAKRSLVKSGLEGAGEVEESLPRTPQETQIMENLEKALDSLSQIPEASDRAVRSAQKSVMKLAAQIATSANPEVRTAAVKAYSSCGSSALPELTGMMADANEEVAQLALDEVQDTLDSMENPVDRFKTASTYFTTFAGDEDTRNMFSSVLSTAGSEMVDFVGDEAGSEQQALENRRLVVETLLPMIESGGECAEEAKSIFESISGLEWKSSSAASAWVANPDAVQ